MQASFPKQLASQLRFLPTLVSHGGLLLALLIALAPLRAFANYGIYAGLVRVGGNDYTLLNDSYNSYGGKPNYQGSDLGTYSSNATLTFNGGELRTFKNGNDDVTTVQLFYAVYPRGNRPLMPSFTNFYLSFRFDGLNGMVGNQSWNEYGGSYNLLTGLAVGDYTLEIYGQADRNGGGSQYLSLVGTTNFTANFTVTAPLPVSLTRFEATRQEANVALSWTTASETNNAGFEAQVSTDGKDFRKLGFVASATPSSLTARTYSFVDREADKTGLRYYRLRQVDLDGKSNFSVVRSVAFEQVAMLRAVPNPFDKTLTLTIEVPAPVAGTLLTLTDALGRVVLRQTVDVPAGASQLTLPDLANLPSGLYVLQLSLGKLIRTVKLVK